MDAIRCQKSAGQRPTLREFCQARGMVYLSPRGDASDPINDRLAIVFSSPAGQKSCNLDARGERLVRNAKTRISQEHVQNLAKRE
jgi:hypothetical protein